MPDSFPDLNYRHLLMGRYLEWRAQGANRTVTAYAREVLLCSRQTFYMWLSGKTPIPATKKRFLLTPSKNSHDR